MFRINNRLATHGFDGDARVTNIDMKYEDAECGYLDDFKIVDVRMLRDGYNKLKDYEFNIDRVIDELNNGQSVVICCEAGQSRSNAVALAVLVKYFGMNFYDAWDLISEKVPISLIDPAHVATIKKMFEVDKSLYDKMKDNL